MSRFVSGVKLPRWLVTIELTVRTLACMVMKFLSLPPKSSGRKELILDTKAMAISKPWTRFPNGTKVRLLEGGQEGSIDGLTELVMGPARNPDGRTQYRLKVGDRSRLLVGQGDLAVLTDNDGVVVIEKQSIEYRRLVTDQLRAELPSNQFVTYS